MGLINMQINGYELRQYVLPLMNANMYVLVAGNRALVMDPIADCEAEQLILDLNIRDMIIILTHEHFDHISGVNAIRQLLNRIGDDIVCTVYASRACAGQITDPDRNMSTFFKAMFIARPEEDRILAEEIFDPDYRCRADVVFDEDLEVEFADLKLVLRETPGHSPGSICIEIYSSDGNLLALATGDSLVQGNKVITRLPGGNKSDYINITRPYLETFGPDTLVLPGHGEISYMRDLELG